MPAASRRPLVTLALPPGDEFAAALDEAWRRGEAVLPVDPHAPRASVEAVVAALRPDEGVDEGIALVIATSGSTGAPKGVELSHAALRASAEATMARIGLQPHDRWLACMPWHHVGGLQVLLRARLFDTPLTVHDSFDVDRVEAERDVTLVSLVPTQLRRLLDAGADVSRFRVVLLGGAMAPPALLERARAAGTHVVTTYGMSETCGGCVYDGWPLDGVEVRVEPAGGRVLLRGAVLMSGYRRRPELTAAALADGWLRTNDVGRLDGDRLVVRGRLDDVIVSGGENVVAPEVAARLAAHPSVADAVVVGLPDEEWGERVVAVVVAAGEAPTLPELREWCRATLPRAAAPRQLVVVDDLPRLASGKHDRLRIAELAGHSSVRTPR